MIGGCLRNAWNNWNEGLQLEPDSTTGFSRLNETTRALLRLEWRLDAESAVIVPNYNHEPFLRLRLDSVYGQTYKNVEVILLDDFSSDQSRHVLDGYAAEYGEITSAIYNDRNSSRPFSQWARGINRQKGSWSGSQKAMITATNAFFEVLVRCFDDEAVLLVTDILYSLTEKELLSLRILGTMSVTCIVERSGPSRIQRPLTMKS